MIGSDRPPAALARHTGFLLNWVAARSRRRFATALEQEGLHPRDFSVLSVIARDPGVTQQTLGESAGVDPSTMVAILDVLEERGFAERRPHETDRRKRAVHLTEEGRRTLARAGRLAARVNDEVFGALSPAERGELDRLLRKLSGADRA